ncbi:syntaxin-1A-like [Lineus longissimus]|uniref:syntaxin-1A-like n=1 Tax=Lineus longissimus TaxID=88925 RepID=UPI002B4F1286
MRDRLEQLRKNMGESSIGTSIRQSFRMSTRSAMKGTRIGQFLKKAESIRGTIEELSKLVEKVKKCHSDILIAVTDKDRHRERLEKITLEIRDVERRIRAGLKDIDPSGEEDRETCSNAELRMRKAQLEALTHDLVTVLQEHQQEQANYNEKCKGQIIRRMKIKQPDLDIDETEIDRIVESNEQTSIFTDDILISIKDAHATLSDLKSREKEMFELEKKIVQVNEIFRDLNLLVCEQGEMIDRIEDNVTNAAEHVHEANVQLKKAEKVKKKWIKRKAFWITIGVVVVLIIIAIIVGIAMA